MARRYHSLTRYIA